MMPIIYIGINGKSRPQALAGGASVAPETTEVGPSSVVTLMVSSLQPDAGVDHRVDDIDQHVDDDDHTAADEDDPLHDREITEADALVEQPPDAGPGEHRFDHDGDVDHVDQ